MIECTIYTNIFQHFEFCTLHDLDIKTKAYESAGIKHGLYSLKRVTLETLGQN